MINDKTEWKILNQPHSPTVIKADPGWSIVCPLHDQNTNKPVGLVDFEIIGWLVKPYDTKEGLTTSYVEPVTPCDHVYYKVTQSPQGSLLGENGYIYSSREEVLEMYKDYEENTTDDLIFE